MIRRHLESELRARAQRMPVVTILGPRQSGKTTLARWVFPDRPYVSLESPDIRAMAVGDPRGFLARHRDGVILDEIQRAPELLSYIQVLVDEHPEPGRFILTGSQNILLMEQVSQTLAGRVSLVHLLPLSVRELRAESPLDPYTLDQPASSSGHRAGQENVPSTSSEETRPWEALWKGWYPRVHAEGLPPQEWLADYVRTYVERDLREVMRVMDLDAFQGFMRLAAARSGQELNLESLAADAGISQPTARHWLTALRIAFLVAILPPHHANFRKRLRKRPKMHFLDSGLLCYLLGIRDPDSLERHPLRGAVFESYVVAELTKAFANIGREAPLYFWRDATGHEIDILIDLGDRLVPVEVRSGVTLTAHAFDTLRWWVELDGNPNRTGVLVYGGAEGGGRQELVARPWFLG